MSHSKERKEKKCLNCGADVFGRYCHVCGQENIETNESIWALISHFFEDITHFDGKFFKTIKVLLLKPAFLSTEYLKGKRASYFHPIRMYIFTSFFFFLIYFSFFQSKNNESSSLQISTSQNEIQKRKDTFANELLKDFYTYKKDSTKTNSEDNYSVNEYDSLIKVGANKDSWIEQKVIRKSLYLSEKYKYNKGQMLTDLVQKFVHSFPQVLFITLPFIAFLLKLLYIRRKNFYYVHHAIFTIHAYCAIFIIILLNLLVGSFLHLIHLDKGFIHTVINFLFFIGSFFYLYKCLRNFYHQGIFKTIFKFLLLFFFSIFIYVFAFLLLFTFTVMTL